jgi:hypothetical protein
VAAKLVGAGEVAASVSAPPCSTDGGSALQDRHRELSALSSVLERKMINLEDGSADGLSITRRGGAVADAEPLTATVPVGLGGTPSQE